MELAKTCQDTGDTYGLNITSIESYPANKVKDITTGQHTNITIDTTGHPEPMAYDLDSTGSRGQMVCLAA